MALQRLNIRARKSFQGLYSFDDSATSPSKSTPRHLESSPRSDITQDTEECDLEDFGAKLERCKAKDSPGKDSPSRCKKLLGSLRSLRSLANLHSSPTKTRQSSTPRLESPTKTRQSTSPRPGSPIKHQEVCMTPLPMSPSLTLLHFEQSPSDRPIFNLTMHQRSASGSSLEVHHSSPMTVPGSARQPMPYSIFPPITDLPAGTIPDTPGPMQRAFDRDPANRIPRHNASPTPLEKYTPSTPLLTPLPGTHLSVGDVDPELVPLPPSANPSTMHLGRSSPGYFDIPVDELSPMDSTDRLNGLACLKLADEHCDNQGDPKGVVCTEALVGRRGTIEEMRHPYEDVKLRNTVKQLDIPHDRTRAHGCWQQAEDLQENVRALGVPKRRQVLRRRPKQQDEDIQDRLRNDSCISGDWETCSGGQSIGGRSLDHAHPNQACKSSSSSVYSTAARAEGCEGAEHDHNSPPHFGCTVSDSASGPRRGQAPENPWGRHTGLYDGTGYGPESSDPSAPREPDGDILDVGSKALSNRHLRGEGLYHETVRESRSTAHEYSDGDSLEAIYRAYAGRIASNSSNSTGGADERRS